MRAGAAGRRRRGVARAPAGDRQERAFLAARGTVSEVATLRSMARLTDGSSQALVQLKAVDDAYPLYGGGEFEDGAMKDALRPGGAVVERACWSSSA